MTEALMLPPGVMIAAPRSGAGKTTVTLGLLRALKRRGLAVQPFKCGPDYIDPAFHAAASGRPSFNVDSWAMRWPVAAKLLSDASHGSDIVVVESLMGLFDGVSQRGHWGNGASADLAAATGWPVILVLDVSGQSQTAAATARGFQNFQDGVTIAGVILNRVGSQRHVRFASEALESGRTCRHRRFAAQRTPRASRAAFGSRPSRGDVRTRRSPECTRRLHRVECRYEPHFAIGAAGLYCKL